MATNPSGEAAPQKRNPQKPKSGDANMVGGSEATRGVRPTQPVATLNRDAIYRQSNDIAQAAQNLDVFEKRLISLGLARIDHNDQEPSFDLIVPIRELEAFGISNPYDRAKQAAHSLGHKAVVLMRKDGGFTIIPWTSQVEYVPSENSDLGFSYVRIQLNENLRPHFTRLREKYGALQALEVIQMPTAISMRLYEYVWQASWAGRRPEFEVDLLPLKHALDLVDVDNRGHWVGEKYADWRDFRRQLRNAVAVFEEKGSLRVGFEGVRVGRRVQRVRFRVEVTKPIEHLNVQPTLFTEEGPSEGRIRERLRNVGFTGSARQLIDEFGIETVEVAVGITESKAREGILNNPGGFLRTLLRDGVVVDAPDTHRINVEKEARGRESAMEQDVDEQWEKHRQEAAGRIIEALALDEALLKEMTFNHVRGLQGGKLVLKALEQGVDSPVFRLYRTAAVLSNHEDLAPITAIDRDAFKKNQVESR